MVLGRTIAIALGLLFSSWLPAHDVYHAYRLPAPQNAFQVTAINDSSQVSGTVTTSTGSFPIIWDPKFGLQYAEVQPGVPLKGGFANDISEHGEIAVAQLNAAPQKAFKWSVSGGTVDLGSLIHGGSAVAEGINNSGHVVGQAWVLGGSRAFFWSLETGMISIEDLPVFAFASGRDINGVGIVCGNKSTGVFTWDMKSGVQSLTAPPGYKWAEVVRINEHGVVCGTVASIYGGSAALYDPQIGTTILHPDPAILSVGRDLNESGQVVGWIKRNSAFAATSHAFVWDAENGMRPLSEMLDAFSAKHVVLGGTVKTAWAINNKGQILAKDGPGAVILTPFLLGDVNCDGLLSQEDVSGLITLLGAERTYPVDPKSEAYGECGWWAGDMNQDAELTIADLPLLLEKLK